jgi:hypothetical protein
MNRLLLLVAALGGLTGWLLFAPMSSAPTPQAPPPPSRLASLVTATAAAAPALVVPAPAAVAPAPIPKLDGARLQRRLDEQIPARLYAEAARCYHGGLPGGERLDLSYKLSVADGDVTIIDAQIESNTLSDPALARCIVERVFAFHERDPQLPDGDSDGDLFIRVGGFKSFFAKVATDGDEPVQ